MRQETVFSFSDMPIVSFLLQPIVVAEQDTPDIGNYLDFMVCILQADNLINIAEKDFLYELMDSFDLSADERKRYTAVIDLHDWLPIEETLEQAAKGLDENALICFTHDAYLMAASDGQISEPEVRVIQSFLRNAGVPDERFPEIDKWGREGIKSINNGRALFRGFDKRD